MFLLKHIKEKTKIGSYIVAEMNNDTNRITDCIVILKPKTKRWFMIPLHVIKTWVLMYQREPDLMTKPSKELRPVASRAGQRWDKYHHAYDNVNKAIALYILDNDLHYTVDRSFTLPD